MVGGDWDVDRIAADTLPQRRYDGAAAPPRRRQENPVSKSTSKKRVTTKKPASRRSKAPADLAVPPKKGSKIRGGVVAIEPYASMMMEEE
jgi:hypothetical protein